MPPLAIDGVFSIMLSSLPCTQHNFPVLSTLSLSLSREGEDLRRSYVASDPKQSTSTRKRNERFFELATMTLDKSLRIKAGGVKQRNVLTRGERIAKLKENDRWTEGSSVLGLPKVRVEKLSIKKKKKAKAEGDESAAPADAAAKSAAPAKTAAPTKK